MPQPAQQHTNSSCFLCIYSYADAQFKQTCAPFHIFALESVQHFISSLLHLFFSISFSSYLIHACFCTHSSFILQIYFACVHLIYSFVERLERRIFPEGVLPIRGILIFKNFGISNCACSHVVPTASLVSEHISYSWKIL